MVERRKIMLTWILRLLFGAGDSGPAIDPNGGRGG